MSSSSQIEAVTGRDGYIELYKYDYMAERGIKDIYEEMRADIVKYVFGEN